LLRGAAAAGAALAAPQLFGANARAPALLHGARGVRALRPWARSRRDAQPLRGGGSPGPERAISTSTNPPWSCGRRTARRS